MITTQDRQAFADVSIIIQMMPKTMRQKINTNFIRFIESNKGTEYKSYINKNIPLKNQNLTENTKTLLALIYRDYLCSTSMREELLLKEQQEIEEIEEEKRKKYAIEFKNSKKIQNKTEKDNSLVVYKKENIIQKLFNKIKEIFKFN